MRANNEKLFVGVDEYDAPANNCLFSDNPDRWSRFSDVADLFKTRFFSDMKSACGTVIQNYWLTGVLPVFRDSFGPLIATTIISTLPQYHGVCGFTEDEVRSITTAYLGSTFSGDDLAQVMRSMRSWYNGYRFCPPGYGPSPPVLYNPQLLFAHLRALRNVGSVSPEDEANVTYSANVLTSISTRGEVKINDLLPLLSGKVEAQPPTEISASEVRKVGRSATWGLLYYFGVITHSEQRGFMRIPNATMKSLVGVIKTHCSLP